MEAIHLKTIKMSSCSREILGQASIAFKRPAPDALQRTGVLLYNFGGTPNSFAIKESDNSKQYRFRN